MIPISILYLPPSLAFPGSTVLSYKMWGLRTSVSLCNLCPGWCHQLSSPGSPNLYVTSWRHFNISSVKPPKYPNTSSQCCVELVVIGTGIFDRPAHSPIFLSLPFIVCFVLSYLYFNYHTNYLHPIIVSPQKIVILSLSLYVLSIFMIKKWKIWKLEVPNPVVALSVCWRQHWIAMWM